MSWTPWAPLTGSPRFTAEGLREQLDGGQAFRWHRQPDDDTWLGQWSTHVARLRLTEDGTLDYALPADDAHGFSSLRHYLAIDDDAHARIAAALPLATDPHMAICHAANPQLRILRQPFGETLLGFLCSATKQILQIKQMLALLAQHHGTPLPATCNVLRYKLCALPTWEQLANATEAELRASQLGFRARYIKGIADVLAANPGWLDETAKLPYEAAKLRLLTLPGVGEKIADCVLLFGLGHPEAFPVDTWMIKAMTRRYGLDGWSPAQVAHFGRVHYGRTAGLAQQLLFAWERSHGGR